MKTGISITSRMLSEKMFFTDFMVSRLAYCGEPRTAKHDVLLYLSNSMPVTSEFQTGS